MGLLLHIQGCECAGFRNYLALYVSTPDYFLNSLPADSADRGRYGERIARPGKRYYLILGTAAEEATRSGCRSRPPVVCLDLERADRTNPDQLRGGVPWFS